MTNPKKKQFIYGLIYLIILLLIGYGFYSAVKPAPSCFDNIQNEGETGVDCGGPCAPCLPDINTLNLIGNAIVLPVNSSTVSILAKIQNTNSEFGASNFNYSYFVYGSNGENMASSTGSDFIFPSQTKYIFIPVISVSSANKVSHAQIKINNVNWLSRDKFTVSNISVSNIVTTSTSSNLNVSGDIFNNGALAIKKANVLVVFYDNLGLIAGASYTEVDNIASLGSQSFVVIHPLINNINTLATKVFVYAQPL